MAQKLLVEHLDDIDGTEADHVDVEFALDGVTYAIDLSDANRQRLHDMLAEFVDAARRTGGRIKRPASAAMAAAAGGSRGPAKSDPEQLAAIREWANRNGFEVHPRGRIPNHVLEAYSKAGKEGADETEKPAAKTAAKARRNGSSKKAPTVLFSQAARRK